MSNRNSPHNHTAGIAIRADGYSDDYSDATFGAGYFDESSSYPSFRDNISLFPCSAHQHDIPGLTETVNSPSEMAGFDFSAFLVGAAPTCPGAAALASDPTFQPGCFDALADNETSPGDDFTVTIKKSPSSTNCDVEIEDLPSALWTFPSASDTLKNSVPSPGDGTSSSNSSTVGSTATKVRDGSKSSSGPKHITSTRKLSRQEAQQVKKAAHSTVEKRYRANLNTKITTLHEQLVRASEEDASVSLMNEEKKSLMSGPPKTRKADVLTDALNFVNRTQKEKKMMKDEIDFLKMRIMTLERLVKCEDCLLLKQVEQMRVGNAMRGY